MKPEIAPIQRSTRDFVEGQDEAAAIAVCDSTNVSIQVATIAKKCLQALQPEVECFRKVSSRISYTCVIPNVDGKAEGQLRQQVKTRR